MWVESNSQKSGKTGFMGLIQGVHMCLVSYIHFQKPFVSTVLIWYLTHFWPSPGLHKLVFSTQPTIRPYPQILYNISKYFIKNMTAVISSCHLISSSFFDMITNRHHLSFYIMLKFRNFPKKWVAIHPCSTFQCQIIAKTNLCSIQSNTARCTVSAVICDRIVATPLSVRDCILNLLKHRVKSTATPAIIFLKKI